MVEMASEDVLLKKSDFWLFSNFSEADFEIPDAYEEVAFEDEFMNVVAISVVTFALFGIVANILVLILSFSHVKGDFRHYVANLALVDIVCGVLFAFMGYINIEDMHKHFSISLMTYSALAFYGSFGVMIWALVPISISRVFALTRHKPYSKALGARLPLVFCFLSDVLPISILYIICIVDHDVARWLFYLYALMTAVAYVIAFTSNYVVFRIVSRHIAVVQNLRDQARLLETRQVSVATLAQALVPLVCQVPAFLTLSSALLLTEPITNGNIISITQLWLASSPMLDAIITILVIKQYRKEAVQCVSSISNRLFHSKKKSTNTITICIVVTGRSSKRAPMSLPIFCIQQFKLMTGHLKECISTTQRLDLQPNTALVKIHGVIDSVLSVKSDECTDCAWWPECIIGNNSQVLFQSVYPSSFKLDNGASTTKSHYFFENQGVYSVFVQDNKMKIVCYKQPFYPNLALYLVPLAIIFPFLLDIMLLLIRKYIKRQNTENGVIEVLPDARKRYGSIDAARGLAMAWMIFVNYQGGSLPFMKHAAWHGFTFADFVFPFFLFIVGASYSLMITKKLNCGFTRKMLLRTGKLFFIGTMLSNASSWNTLHILGVLQRIALAHIVFHFIRVLIDRMTSNYTPVTEDEEEVLYVSAGLQKEFIFVFLLALITTFVQLLPAEGCPSLYLGPGGISQNGTYFNCTGGFARYIDHIVLGDSHMYQWPTCKAVYHTIVPFDPEGLLGTFLAVGNIFAGFYTVNKLREPWTTARNQLSMTSIGTLVLALFLHFSVLPINKNLWTLSFVLLTSGLAQLVFLGFYYVVDHSEVQLPVLQTMGKYPLTLYIFHELAEGRFPVNWAVAPDTVSQFAMSAYGVFFHSILACVLSCGIF